MSRKGKRIDELRLWLLLGLAAAGVLLHVTAWPRSFADRLARGSRNALLAEAMEKTLQPLSEEQGAIYLENPNEFFYYYAVYYTFPRSVYITDRKVLINNNDDILGAATPLTPRSRKKLNITCLIRPDTDGIAVYRLK